jgi:hypothetical protein
MSMRVFLFPPDTRPFISLPRYMSTGISPTRSFPTSRYLPRHWRTQQSPPQQSLSAYCTNTSVSTDYQLAVQKRISAEPTQRAYQSIHRNSRAIRRLGLVGGVIANRKLHHAQSCFGCCQMICSRAGKHGRLLLGSGRAEHDVKIADYVYGKARQDSPLSRFETILTPDYAEATPNVIDINTCPSAPPASWKTLKNHPILIPSPHHGFDLARCCPQAKGARGRGNPSRMAPKVYPNHGQCHVRPQGERHPHARGAGYNGGVCRRSGERPGNRQTVVRGRHDRILQEGRVGTSARG